MKITRIVVENFCSIEHADITPTDFTIFVGQNNHGKTNFFEAISWFYSGKGDPDKLRFGRKGDAEVSVEITFSGVQEALKGMKNEKNKASIEKVLDSEDTIRAKRIGGEKTRKIYDASSGTWLDKNPTGFDSAFNDFLPMFEYVSTSTHLSDIAKFGKTTPVGSMLSGVLMALLEKSHHYQEFREKFANLFTDEDSDVRMQLDNISAEVTVFIAKQFPDCTKVVFQIAEPAFEELLKGCATEVDDGILTDATEKGDGMQRALMLAIIQTYANFRKKGEAAGKNFLFFIDEAELHLHPTAQRKLKEALRDVSKGGDQVFINTHSSVLVADDFPEQSIFRVEKSNKRSSIVQVTSSGKPMVVYELLGGSPADLLLPRNFLIVEGRSDQDFIAKIIDRFYADKPPVQILFSEGDIEKQRKTMNAINTLFAPIFQNPVYRDRLTILCDAPATEKSTKDFAAFKASYPSMDTNGQIFILPKPSIEECYPAGYAQTPEQVVDLRNHQFQKCDMAKHVASQITQAQFENEMPVLKAALEKAWESAYS